QQLTLTGTQAEVSTDSTAVTPTTPKSTGSNRQVFNKTSQLPPFSISEFKYSPTHVRLLHNVFDTIEEDVRSWRSDPTKSITDFINHNDNQIFCVNVVHIISQMADIVCNSSGGLLPLLASATSASHEIEILENTEGLTPIEALKILKRVMAFVDLFVLANNTSFSELEQEKNMPGGGIIRQCLRLTMTAAVRHCMECRLLRFDSTKIPQQPLITKASQQKFSAKDPIEAILELTQLMNPNNEDHIQNDGAHQYDDISTLLSSVIKNPDSVLQELDVHRLRALLYRDVDDSKQSQFLALAIVYFASVLMVSRYRDIIETNQTSLSRKTSAISSSSSVKNGTTDSANVNTDTVSVNNSTVAVSNNTQKNLNEFVSSEDKTDGNNDHLNGESLNKTPLDSTDPSLSDQLDVASIPVDNPSTSDKDKYAQLVKNDTSLPDYPKANFSSTEAQSSMNITEKLERALSNVAPFLRDVFTEFSQLLTKTLVGSHGQELLPGGLNALKQTTNVVELVMLLCSQEWQNSLQKHAGLAFIELVNEGRLLSHASKDHVVKVASEADFILNRMRADDVGKASEFEQLCAQTTVERKEEERLCDHFLCAARKRHQAIAIKLKEKFLAMMINDKSTYLNTSANKNSKAYWKLDAWEDDLRRRRRIIKNPTGTSHPEAILKPAITQNVSNEDAINTAAKEDSLHKQLKQKSQNFVQTGEDEDTLQVDEKDLDQEFTGPVRFSTECMLISCGAIVKGTLAITSSAMLYDTDEIDETFTSLDQKVLPYIENLHGKWHFNEIRAIFSRRYLLQD
ncbi:unnamed protein product, partial [Didymodactylos carnosus]